MEHELKKMIKAYEMNEEGSMGMSIRKVSKHGDKTKRLSYSRSKNWKEIKVDEDEFGYTRIQMPKKRKKGMEDLDLEKGDTMWLSFSSTYVEEKMKDRGWNSRALKELEERFLKEKGITDGEVLRVYVEQHMEHEMDVKEIIRVRTEDAKVSVTASTEECIQVRNFAFFIGYRDGSEYLIEESCDMFQLEQKLPGTGWRWITDMSKWSPIVPPSRLKEKAEGEQKA